MDRSDASTSLSYRPQLDGLRAVSVFGVMFAHYLPEGHPLGWLPLGAFGVHCFFVLSGYLITSLLLRAREAVDAGRSTRREAWLHFYMRRVLRIFPIYYLTIAVICLADVQHARQSLGWMLTYTSNVQFSLAGQLLWSVGHFWTLSVEEQFYLVWPWVILGLPQRLLLRALGITVLICPLFQFVCRAIGPAAFTAMSTLPFGSLDALGLGALLAAYEFQGDGKSREQLVRLGWRVGLPLYALFTVMRLVRFLVPTAQVMHSFSQSLLCAAIVAGAAQGGLGLVGRMLSSAPLRYLGRISYGMYVYHVFMLVLVPWVLGRCGLAMPANGALRFLLLAAATVAVSTVSWYVIERPLNGLKRYFR